ncbi:MAG: HlyD family type I secretion periplasmic adaptor subunit [Rubrivivax sp.]
MLNKLFRRKAKDTPAQAAGKPAVDFLPDADEIERSPLPWLAQLTVWVVMVGLVSMLAWASLAKLDQMVSATGKLINPVPNVVVQPLETSIIQSVDVRAGEVVKQGQQLATLDATFAKADETQLRTRLQSLDTQVASLQQELGVRAAEPAAGASAAASADQKLQDELRQERRANFTAQHLRVSETVNRLRAALATNRQDQQLIANRLRSVTEIEQMQEKGVASKYGAALQLLEAQQRTQEIKRELELATSREREIRRELAAAEAERQAFERGWRQKTMEDLLAITRERDSLREQLDKAAKRQSHVRLLAPVDGVVLEIAKLSRGSIVREAETFFTLVPLDVQLEAEAQIDATDIGYMKVGDAVRLKIDAFPFQRHGVIQGTVRSISQDAFKLDGSSGGAVGTSFYLVKIAMPEPKLDNMKPESRLLPGMTLNAEVVVGERSVMSYLLWPLTKGLNEAIREP